MSIEISVLNYLNTAWGARCQIVWPNTKVEKSAAVFTYPETQIFPHVRQLGSPVALEFGENPATQSNFVLGIAIRAPEDKGTKESQEHCDKLSEIFSGKKISIGNEDFYFQHALRTTGMPEVEYKKGWITQFEVKFTVYNN